MSQAATKKKIILQNPAVRVVARFIEGGSVLAGTKEGACESFDITLSLEGTDSPAVIADLVRLAHRMCFTEDVLTRTVPVHTHHRYNGQPLESG